MRLPKITWFKKDHKTCLLLSWTYIFFGNYLYLIRQVVCYGINDTEDCFDYIACIVAALVPRYSILLSTLQKSYHQTKIENDYFELVIDEENSLLLELERELFTTLQEKTFNKFFVSSCSTISWHILLESYLGDWLGQDVDSKWQWSLCTLEYRL